MVRGDQHRRCAKSRATMVATQHCKGEGDGLGSVSVRFDEAIGTGERGSPAPTTSNDGGGNWSVPVAKQPCKPLDPLTWCVV